MAVNTGASLQFQNFTEIPLSDKGRTSQTITKENAAIAISALHRDGIVCLSNAVDPDHIKVLHDRLADEVEVLRNDPTTYWNNNSEGASEAGKMAQGPPLEPGLMFSDIWANGPALAIISSMLGPNPCVNFVGGNTVLGNFKGVRQNVHPDLTFNHGMIPFAYCANVYLDDTNTENGSTELWLGSHRDCSYAQLWHAGIPSRSPNPRMMLAFVHTAWWYECPIKVLFSESARLLVEQWAKKKHPVMYNAHFVPDGLDHPPFTPNFDSENVAFRALLPKMEKEN